MTEESRPGLSAERAALLRHRLQSGFYSSAEALDRLTQRLIDVLRRPE